MGGLLSLESMGYAVSSIAVGERMSLTSANMSLHRNAQRRPTGTDVRLPGVTGRGIVRLLRRPPEIKESEDSTGREGRFKGNLDNLRLNK